MVQKGKTVVYRDKICKIVDIVEKYKDNEDYYFLEPASDPSLHIKVPVSLAKDHIHPLMSKAEIEILIQRIPHIECVSINQSSRGAEYESLLNKGSHECIVQIIKTAYLRRQERSDRHQKPNEHDKRYFRQAEQRLYGEIAASLGIGYDEAKEYVESKVLAATANLAL